MVIRITVTPAAKETRLIQQEDGQYKAWVKALPVRGEANMALVSLLADHFGVNQNSIRIISGYTSRNKTISIEK